MDASETMTDGDGGYGALVEAFLGHRRDTPVLLQHFCEARPADARGPALRALMLTLLARRELHLPAQEAAAEAARLFDNSGGDLPERAFVQAASAAAHGAWPAAIDRLEQVISLDPLNTMAIKLSHAFRFMLGDKAGMRYSITRALRAIPEDHSHYGYLLGCAAFAAEENGDFSAAERMGHRAVLCQPCDAWGLHAVSHVHEMTGRFEDGIRWIETHRGTFETCNNFGGHLFWHLALFKLEQGAIGEVYALYDQHIRAEKTDDFRDVANGAALLMRLELLGHPVGDRWEELADKAEARLSDRSYVFADLHYMLALMGARRSQGLAAYAQSFLAMPASVSCQSELARREGARVGAALAAYAAGDMRRAVTDLRSARSGLSRIGGSDAQRDIFEMILIDATLKAGQDDLARRLLNERLDGRGGVNRFAQTRLHRLAQQPSGPRGFLALEAALAFARPAH